MLVKTGSYDPYEWLITDLDLRELLQFCPQAALGKYAAVTANDSGVMDLTAREIAEGWTVSGEIAYSPKLGHLENLPHELCGHFDEWYLFSEPAPQLGSMSHRNVFEANLEPGEVFAFVNYYDFFLNDDGLLRLFWKQLAWIKPESYFADTSDHLWFVTRNRDLFKSVRARLELES